MIVEVTVGVGTVTVGLDATVTTSVSIVTATFSAVHALANNIVNTNPREIMAFFGWV